MVLLIWVVWDINIEERFMRKEDKNKNPALKSVGFFVNKIYNDRMYISLFRGILATHNNPKLNPYEFYSGN
jgi:hypothetical protein